MHYNNLYLSSYHRNDFFHYYYFYIKILRVYSFSIYSRIKRRGKNFVFLLSFAERTINLSLHEHVSTMELLNNRYFRCYGQFENVVVQ